MTTAKPQRTNLIPLLNTSGYFSGKFSYWSRDKKHACFVSIKNRDGNLLADHVWITVNGFSKFHKRCDYTFYGKVKKYIDKNGNWDYTIGFVTNFKLSVERR